jgi:hypothetical protein
MKKRTVEVELTEEQSRAVDKNIEQLEKDGFFEGIFEDAFERKTQDKRQVYQDVPHQDEAHQDSKELDPGPLGNPFLPDFSNPLYDPEKPERPPTEEELKNWNPFLRGPKPGSEKKEPENPFLPKFSSWLEDNPDFECRDVGDGRLCTKKPKDEK